MNFNGGPGFAGSSGSGTVIGDLSVTGAIRMSDGSDAMPSLTYTSEADLGFEKSATGEISIVSKGTKSVKISDTKFEVTRPAIFDSSVTTTGVAATNQPCIHLSSPTTTYTKGPWTDVLFTTTDYARGTGLNYDSGTGVVTVTQDGYYEAVAYGIYDQLGGSGNRDLGIIGPNNFSTANTVNPVGGEDTYVTTVAKGYLPAGSNVYARIRVTGSGTCDITLSLFVMKTH